MDLVEVTESIDIPPSTGKEGFLMTVSKIISLGRVQRIVITPGKVIYTYLRQRADEEDNNPRVLVDFQVLMPAAVVRNSKVVELEDTGETNLAVVVAAMFRRAGIDRVAPVAFVGGTSPNVWRWYRETTKLGSEIEDELFGLPFLTDRNMPDESLFLCAAGARNAPFSETVRSYKVMIPAAFRGAHT